MLPIPPSSLPMESALGTSTVYAAPTSGGSWPMIPLLHSAPRSSLRGRYGARAIVTPGITGLGRDSARTSSPAARVGYADAGGVLFNETPLLERREQARGR